MSDTVPISPETIEAHRRAVADLEATARRSGLAPDGANLLLNMRASLERIDRAAVAPPPAPARGGVEMVAPSNPGQEAYAAWLAGRNGAGPGHSPGMLGAMTAAARAAAARPDAGPRWEPVRKGGGPSPYPFGR